MNPRFRVLVFCLLVPALGFGFLHHLGGEGAPDFERLHIFLFNLVTGGTIIYLYSQGAKSFTRRGLAFFLLGLAFALSAFLEAYPPAMFLAVLMSGLVESVRMKKFSVFPWDFFRPRVPVSEKFLQASLLCLSIGLLFSAFTMANHHWGPWVPWEKLTLNTFFLGFSFPVSLITMSVMFKNMRPAQGAAGRALEEAVFWVINLGVITFFVFILAKWDLAQLFISCTLFSAVAALAVHNARQGFEGQEKVILTSGLGFLLFTALSGILYISMDLAGMPHPPDKIILRVHTFLSLYGWNLSGLAVILRTGSFPVGLKSAPLVALHWLVVAILAPMGYYLPLAALACLILYAAFLGIVLFSRGAAPNPENVSTKASQGAIHA